ncbi:hypothetical protein [Burkholderia pseudomallei]|uniref:hypothetical protein n=1 Tax=Burkholderia pseudomallei TaxID=28450 RepID=UPI000A1A0B84|nr:hypothetical protein [Burkholderia pseudomallei]ARK96953.1 hypothetical protein BOC43_21515 [Burkholderia pseudomallei]AYE29042.1 hypothetical protein CNX72_18165 [Burkholderia pseudomallei]CAJ4377742.1 Uncharacterised protein [Burkholderia pseudomallei]CAJ5786843.1 Uncharacterised protein [Burkholderia pseudomallei]VBG94463.1 Uncharacterised protein [Burkholderia pseudomallei]
MTIKPTDPHSKIRLIADLYIDELLHTPEKDLLDDAKSDTSLEGAGKMAKEAYLLAKKAAGKSRIEAARQAIDKERSVDTKVMSKIDIDKARALLKRISANDPLFKTKFTLAARNLEDISDAEILDIVTDLKNLGAFPEDPGL